VSVLGIVLVVIVVLVAALAVGGLIISRRRARGQEARLRAELEEANQAQASAHAQDKGWHRDVLEQAAREARLHAPDGLELRVDAGAGVVASGDPERVHQVVANLVENAVRHSPVPGEILLRGRAADGSVVIEVADEGPGIPEEEAERVFERFYRPDPSRSAPAGGAGLGLSIARWIVDLHGGTIRVEEAVPHGCRMVVELPRAEDAAPRA
jgi:signal transduction histidine kinase